MPSQITQCLLIAAERGRKLQNEEPAKEDDPPP